MDVLTFETCWAVNSEIIKQVTSSWSIFIQLSCIYMYLFFCNSKKNNSYLIVLLYHYFTAQFPPQRRHLVPRSRQNLYISWSSVASWWTSLTIQRYFVWRPCNTCTWIVCEAFSGVLTAASMVVTRTFPVMYVRQLLCIQHLFQWWLYRESDTLNGIYMNLYPVIANSIT